jgi:hypothetical protein
MNRWAKAGVLDKQFEKMQEEQIVRIKIEAVSLDSTIVKVHPDGTGALKKRTASRRQIPRRMEHQIVKKRPKMAFRVLIIGGTGQVGAAVVRALAAEPSCAEVVMVNRRAISLTADPRVRQVILDTAAAQFPAEVTKLAQSMVAQGDPVYGASCVGVGKGSMKWSEEELKALEIGVVGGFARGCQAGGITRFSLLSAVGSTAKSRIRYVRVMGLKEETVQGMGFQRLAIFRPGIIAGNAHTPRYVAWLGRLIPGRFGTIEQDDIGRAFVAEFISSSISKGVVYLENGAMRQRSRAFK